jgi:hypothetical protein
VRTWGLMSASPSLVPSSPIAVDKLSDEILADEAGELLRQQALWNPSAKRLELLKKEIVRRCENVPADQPAAIEGRSYRVNLPPRENQKKITSIAKVYKTLGMKAFLAACSISLSALEESLKFVGKGHLFATLWTEARTGPRSVTAVAKLPPAA